MEEGKAVDNATGCMWLSVQAIVLTSVRRCIWFGHATKTIYQKRNASRQLKACLDWLHSRSGWCLRLLPLDENSVQPCHAPPLPHTCKCVMSTVVLHHLSVPSQRVGSVRVPTAA
jgi:hypothetical protein